MLPPRECIVMPGMEPMGERTACRFVEHITLTGMGADVGGNEKLK